MNVSEATNRYFGPGASLCNQRFRGGKLIPGRFAARVPRIRPEEWNKVTVLLAPDLLSARTGPVIDLIFETFVRNENRKHSSTASWLR